MSNHTLLGKFKQKARAIEPTQSATLDFPFTNLQLVQLKTEEQRELFLNSVLLTADQMANKIFANADEKLILFFAAYLFVYQSPRSNFRWPDFYDIPLLDKDIPDEILQIKNDHIRFGLYETAKNVKSTAAFNFCFQFAKDLSATYVTKKSDFQVEDLLAKIGAPFLIDDLEECKKFCIFDGRRTADQVRLFIFDAEAGHIEALKIKNPVGTSYEYDENFMAYGRVRGTFFFPVAKGNKVHFVETKETDSRAHFIDTRDIETDSDFIMEKLAACERFCFI